MISDDLAEWTGTIRRLEPNPDQFPESLISSRNHRAQVRVSHAVTRAVLDGVVLAESDDVRVVEGVPYFPTDSVDMEYLMDSPTTSRCFWKGKARYWHVVGPDGSSPNAAFAYDHPWPLARKLVTDRIAFWQDVQVLDD